MNMYAVFAAGR